MLPPACNHRRIAALIAALGATALLNPAIAAAQDYPATDGPPASRQPQRQAHFMAYNYQGGVPRTASADGMGMFAMSDNTAVNLAEPDHLTSGPTGSLWNQAAGFGWKSHNITAMVGYMKPSSVKSATQFQPDSYTPAYKTRAHFGVGWAMHF